MRLNALPTSRRPARCAAQVWDGGLDCWEQDDDRLAVERLRPAIGGVMRRLGVQPVAGPVSTMKAALSCHTNLDGPPLDAPDCYADQGPTQDPCSFQNNSTRNFCATNFNGADFGMGHRFAFWPSPHPRIRWTVASPGRAQGAGRPACRPPSRVFKCPTKC
jgi:hypothetical protein